MAQNMETSQNPGHLNNYTLDPGHALYLHHSDSPNCSLTSELLMEVITISRGDLMKFL